MKPVDSLRGLEGVQLVTEVLSEPEDQKGSLRPAVQKMAEERLRAGGIRLLDAKEIEQVPGKPRLELYFTKGDAARGCLFRVFISLRQEIALARNTAIHLLSGTWGDGGASRGGFDPGAEVATFAYYIDRFVADWQAAHGTPAPATTEPAQPAEPPQVAESAALAPAPTPPPPPDPAAAAVPLDGDDVARLQARLRVLGYNPGPVDGLVGARTRAAIRAYERDYGLTVTGEPAGAVLGRLLAAQSPPGTLP
jgi:hypothetical protein